MRRLIALPLVALAFPATASAAPAVGHYGGSSKQTTSKLVAPVSFTMAKRPNKDRFLKLLSVNFWVTCKASDNKLSRFKYSFPGSPTLQFVQLTSTGTINASETYFDKVRGRFEVTFKGKFGPRSGSGTLRLRNNGTCRSDATWSAKLGG